MVLPSEFGTRRKWYFPVTDSIAYCRRILFPKSKTEEITDSVVALNLNEDELKFEDADVKDERRRVLENAHDPRSPLIMKQMRKVYAGRGGSGKKLAVKDVTVAVEEGVIFGL